MESQTVRIAMWSGPRNISTALMRAWENRPDTIVCDEPFYAHYLEITGDDHPGAAEIIGHDETDPRRVIATLTRELDGRENIFYQKHMGQHILPGLPLDWLATFRVGFLVRSPAEMIASYLKVRGTITLDETGLPQQVELFKQIVARGDDPPPVLDAADVLRNPRSLLESLCARFDVPFVDSMLNWPGGPRESDGVWAKYWYSQVEQTTGFGEYRPRDVDVPRQYRGLLEQCNDLYAFLFEKRITAPDTETT